jgi:hypothetical protein
MTETVAASTEQPKLDPAEYNRLVAHAKVHNIRLINSRYDVKPVALAGSRQDWDYNVSYQLLDWHCDSDALLLSGTWEYIATCMQGKRKLLTVTAKYLVSYRLSAICDPDAGRSFLERVGKFAAYPYFRSTFASLTQQSGMVLHPLPVISEQPRWVTPPAQTTTQAAAQSTQKPDRKKNPGAAANKREASDATKGTVSKGDGD